MKFPSKIFFFLGDIKDYIRLIDVPKGRFSKSQIMFAFLECK